MGCNKNLYVFKITWDGTQPNEFEELIAFSLLNNRIIVWNDLNITDGLCEFVFCTTEVYNEQLNLNEEATNIHLGIIEALADLS